MKLCGNKDMTLEIIYQEMLTKIAVQLRRLGIVKKGAEAMDLWRVGSTTSPLPPNCAVMVVFKSVPVYQLL